MLEQNDDHYEPERGAAWAGLVLMVFAIALGVLVLLTVAWCWWHGDLT